MKVPKGFTRHDTNASSILARHDVADELLPLLATPPWTDAERFASCRWLEGRGQNPVVPLSDGRCAVLRTYRHGGLLKSLTRDLFLGFLPRPFRELSVSTEARRRGIVTPPVLGAAVYRVVGPFHRGVVAVEEIPAARDGLSILVQAAELGPRQRRQLFRALLPSAGRTVGTAHREGLVHTDLNVRNLVFSAEDLRVSIIDLDSCRLEPGELLDWQRRAQLRRLRRSLDKVTSHEGVPELNEYELLLFLKAYGETSNRSLREVLRMMDGWC